MSVTTERVKVSGLEFECTVKNDGKSEIRNLRIEIPGRKRALSRSLRKKIRSGMCKKSYINSADVDGSIISCQLNLAANRMSLTAILDPIAQEINSKSSKRRQCTSQRSITRRDNGKVPMTQVITPVRTRRRGYARSAPRPNLSPLF